MLLVDLFEYATTPCSWRARSMGFLRSSLEVQSRYRRCRRAWEPHLARTRQAILDAAALAPGRRTAVIMGAGLLHDVPLAELSVMFREVLLVDLVFPWSSRFAAARFPNVRCQTADVTETLHALPRAAADAANPLPSSAPTGFLDHPTLDFTVSLNLLSQLPVIPARCLQRRRPGEREAWSRQLQHAHLDYLHRLPGHTALITDIAGLHRDRTGATTHEWDNLHGLSLPAPSETWEWALAPAPEADADLDHIVRVSAYLDWKSAPRSPAA